MNKKTKKPTLRQNIMQWSITAITLLFIWSMVSYSIGVVVESTGREELKWHLSDLNNGDYADLASSYILNEHLGYTDDEGFLQFDEFELFYRQYILCVEYQHAVNPEEYQEEIQGCITKMEQICKSSQYEQNVPHYEYLIESLMVVDKDNL